MEEETKTIEEIMEENQELDSEYIGTQVANGLTSGILDNPAGYRISDTSYRDSDSGHFFHETEEEPTGYELFLSKEKLEVLYREWLKEHGEI